MLIDTNHSPARKNGSAITSQFENDARVFRTTTEHTNALCMNPHEVAHTHGVQTTLSDRSGRTHPRGSRASARGARHRASNPAADAGLRDPLMPHCLRGVAAAAQADRVRARLERTARAVGSALSVLVSGAGGASGPYTRWR